MFDEKNDLTVIVNNWELNRWLTYWQFPVEAWGEPVSVSRVPVPAGEGGVHVAAPAPAPVPASPGGAAPLPPHPRLHGPPLTRPRPHPAHPAAELVQPAWHSALPRPA